MNSSKHGAPRRQQARPFQIVYIKGERQLRDSARTIDEAKTRIASRLSKRHNAGERAEVYHCPGGTARKLVFSN